MSRAAVVRALRDTRNWMGGVLTALEDASVETATRSSLKSQAVDI